MSRNVHGRRRWRFSFWPVLAFVGALPLLLWLGMWQVERGLDKAAAYADFENASASDARDVTGLPLNAFNALPRYEHVRLRGHYLEGRNFLLDNMSHNGRPGHHVLTPFVPDGTNYAVMVDRGWRPGLARQNDNVTREGEARVVTGMLSSLPQPALQLDGKPRYEGWPRTVQFPQASELGEMLGRHVATPRLLLDERAPGGFVRDWEPPGIPPARHYAYAFQWFGLALALIVIFIIVARPRHPEDSEK